MGSTGGAAFPPISNYKGVMLCDRPSADVGPKKPKPFNAAARPPQIVGLPPPKKVNLHSNEHKEKDTESALYKHKQYLAQLKREIKAQKEEQEQEAEAEKAKKKRFVERSAQLRDAIRAGLLAESAGAEAQGPSEDAASAPVEAEEQPKVSPVADEPAPPVVPSLNLPKNGEHPGAELLNKPAWALTEGQAEEKDELQEEVDVDELLDFVEDLDFEAYVDDLEVQQALEIMRSRIATLDTERTGLSTEGEPKEVTVLRPEAEEDDAEGGWDNSVAASDNGEETEGRGEAVKAAKELLGSSRKLRAVHSTASIAKRLEALKEEAQAALLTRDARLAQMEGERDIIEQLAGKVKELNGQLAAAEKEKKLYVEAVKMLKLRLQENEARVQDFAAKRG